MIVACNIVLNVSRRGCNFVLNMIRYAFELMLRPFVNPTTSNLSPEHQSFLYDFPRDVRAPVRAMHLDTQCKIFAVCPDSRCHHLHEPKFHDGSPIPQYPHRCEACRSHKRKTALLHTRVIAGKDVPLPIKPYVHHDFQDWMGGLLSRPGNETAMDTAWEETLKESTAATPVTSIFGAKVLRNFMGPDGKTLFGDGGDEGRYVFSLGVDFFNPFGNKQAGKKRSIGIITVMCLNLPPHLRYRPENIFLAGIIPGPNEPRWHLVNCYLAPLVDDFLVFWTPGVWFNRTSLYPNGRFILCAIVVVVCDCPAARKVAGFASFNHNYFCHVCYCTRKQHGYGNTDYFSWRRRTHADVQAEAEWWKATVDGVFVSESESMPEPTSESAPREDTSSSSPRADHKVRPDPKATAHGIRWSALLRLPYFDIVRFVVVDGMHNLFLGLIKDHFRQVLGLDHAGKIIHDEEAKGKASAAPKSTVLDIPWSGGTYAMLSKKAQEDVRYLRRTLEGPLNEALADPQERAMVLKRIEGRLKDALICVCEDIRIDVRPVTRQKTATKLAYATALLDWVRCLHFCLSMLLIPYPAPSTS